jgi:hypothetical protein
LFISNCAKKWLKDRNHLNNCACLEREAKELYLLFANSLKRHQKKLKECQCETSEKVRVDYPDSEFFRVEFFIFFHVR